MTKEFLRKHNVEFDERNIAEDPSAVDKLREIGAMTTPVSLIGDEPVIGFDEGRLRELLGIE